MKKYLLVFPGFVSELIHCLPEQRDITEITILVL